MFQWDDTRRNAKGFDSMLTIALSVLFGLVAFAALAQIYDAVGTGLKRGRLILAELSRQERAAVKVKATRPALQPALAAA
jgi:hypothetical protein